MNRVIIHGRCAKDPDVKTTQSGKVFARISVACDRGKDKGADFIPCIAWERTAEMLGKYWSKGKEILVEGRIATGSYQAQDGTKRYTTDVLIDRVEFCGSKSDNGEGGAFNKEAAARMTDETDQIPF